MGQGDQGYRSQDSMIRAALTEHGHKFVIQFRSPSTALSSTDAIRKR